MYGFSEILAATGLAVRTALNKNFKDLYEGFGGGCVGKQAFSAGVTTPGSKTNPSEITSIAHTWTEYSSTTPYIVIIPKCDWMLYVSSVSKTGCVIGCGSTGSATTLNYDILIIHPPSAITLT